LISSGYESRHEASFPWCYLVSSFPRTQGTIIDRKLQEYGMKFGSDSSRCFYRTLLLSSRPLFAQLALKLLKRSIPETVDELDYFLQELANDLVSRKSLFCVQEGLHGQVALTLNAYFQSTNSASDHMPAPFVQNHFAVLELVNNKASYDRIDLPNLDVNQSGYQYQPKTLFPKPADDTLLYLALMGNQFFHPFWNGARRISFREALDSLMNSSYGSKAIRLSNARQTSNDGMFLEALLASSVTVSSHINGLRGAPLIDFLAALIYHALPNVKLDIQTIRKTLDSNIRAHLPPSLIDLRIPFLGPPDTEWPSFLSTFTGINLGTIHRTGNLSQIDFRIPGHGISGEAKDYKDPVPSETMKEILRKVPADSKLHIVLTNRMQASYFDGNDKTRADWVDLRLEHPRLNKAVYLRIGDGVTAVDGLKTDCTDLACACHASRCTVCPLLDQVVVFMEAVTH
jgi:hypothetical protein